MKKLHVLSVGLIVLAFAFFTQMAQAQTPRYVATNGPGPSPYTSWGTAASNIQDAISACVSGDVVWVTNGTYDTGGVTNYPDTTVLTNRVAITNAITVRSVNGPTLTTIKGVWDPATNGPAAVRCVYMVNNSSLIGFTVTNGATMGFNLPVTNDNHKGGGIWCPGTIWDPAPYPTNMPVISNCVITGNSAHWGGGGTYRGNLYNCTLSGNSAYYWGGGAGGYSYVNGPAYLYNCTLSGNRAWLNPDFGDGMCAGAFGSILYNCTLISNTADYGAAGGWDTLYNCTIVNNSGYITVVGGSILYNCTIVNNSPGGYTINNNILLYNCISWGNTAPDSGTATSYYSCGSGAPYESGAGNITNNPKFITDGSNYRLNANSPCVNTGTNQDWMTTTYPYDLDGRQRIRYGTVDMGAYERINSGTIYGFH